MEPSKAFVARIRAHMRPRVRYIDWMLREDERNLRRAKRDAFARMSSIINPDVIFGWTFDMFDDAPIGAYTDARERFNELCDYLSGRAWRDLCATFAYIMSDGDGEA